MACLSLFVAARAAAQNPRREPERIGLPYDWSHRHLIFSRPGSFERLNETRADIRYWQQLYRGVYRPDAAPPGGPVERRPNPRQPIEAVDWSESLGTTPANFAGLVTYPAKYSFNAADPTPNCTNDYVVFTVPTGAGGKANIYGFNNLYVNNSGTGACTGTAPKALFAYSASQNNGGLDSSPALSLDGTQIAFVENAGSAQFHVLKWKSGNVPSTFGSPYNSSPLKNCATNGAVAPCEYSVVYTHTSATLSAPYIDYGSDTAYLTDDQGLVTAIHPVFGGGTPAVLWSVFTLGGEMTPPVYDPVSKNVFASDNLGLLYYVRTNASSSGTCFFGSAPCLGASIRFATTFTPVTDAPIVDSSSGTVFVFSNSDFLRPNSSVVQTTTTLSTYQSATVGPTGTQVGHSGAFNNAYYSNPGSGLLYVCGTNSSQIPQLYAISFTGTSMNTGPAAHGPLALGTASNSSCAPLTEVYNQSRNKDYLLLSVTNGCPSASNSGCIQEFDITAGFPAASIGSVVESGGTTGIIIDNVSNGASGNASQTNLYFGTLGTQSCSEFTGGSTSSGNCLVKLTQTGLQ